VLGLEGEPLQGLSKSPSSPATPHKHRLGTLTQVLFRSQGLLPFPGPYLPPASPCRTPFKWGLSFICSSQPLSPAIPASRGRGHSGRTPYLPRQTVPSPVGRDLP